jgi:hypothetical protein
MIKHGRVSNLVNIDQIKKALTVSMLSINNRQSAWVKYLFSKMKTKERTLIELPTSFGKSRVM